MNNESETDGHNKDEGTREKSLNGQRVGGMPLRDTKLAPLFYQEYIIQFCIYLYESILLS